jgi:hypothetical protein
MAEIPTLQEKGSIDTDQDGQISVRESAEYLTQKAAELPLGLKVIVNKKPIHLEVRSKDITINSERLALPTLRIELELFAPLPESPPTVTWEIIYEDRNYSQRLGWKEIIARAGPSMKIKESNVPQKDLSNALKSYPEKMLNTPPDAMNARIIVVPGTIDAPVLTSESSSAADVTTWEDRFIRLIKAKELTPRIYLIAFLISVGLGAMHALSPPSA